MFDPLPGAPLEACVRLRYDGSDKTWVNPEKAKELWDAAT